MSEQWLGPGEMSRRLGVTPKALRVYEREGLVTAARTEAGWRVYGPAQAARLHQIMALKGLGLPLKRIKTLLVEGGASLADVLSLQRDSLTGRAGEKAGFILQVERDGKIGHLRRHSANDLLCFSLGGVGAKTQAFADDAPRLIETHDAVVNFDHDMSSKANLAPTRWRGCVRPRLFLRALQRFAIRSTPRPLSTVDMDQNQRTDVCSG